MRVRIAPGVVVETDEPLESVEELREAWASNPLGNYWPQPPQLEFHKAVARRLPVVAFFGGNQSGKTHCSIADDLIQLLPRDVVPPHLQPFKRWEPPVHMWIGCPKHKKLNEAIFPKIRELCPPSQLKGGGFDNAYSDKDAELKFTCGSTIGFKTYEMDVDAFSSATLHRMHWDEEPKGEHGADLRKEARARLLKFGGDEILSMTPLLGLSWVYEQIYEPWERGDPNIFCVRADIDDNEYIDQAFKEQFLAVLTKEEIEARKEGKFVHFRGLVYPEWDEHKHVAQPVSLDWLKGQDVIVGIDPGIRTSGIAFCAFDRDNSMTVFDELYLHDDDAIPENAAKFIRSKLRAWGVEPQLFLIDPSGRSREIVTGERIDRAYVRAGIPVLPGVADKETGVFEVRRRLQHRDVLLHFTSNCRIARWEIGRYRMDDRADGKFEVVKENDHLMDPIRYVAMARPLAIGREDAEPKPFRWEPGTAPAYEDMNPSPSIDWGL